MLALSSVVFTAYLTHLVIFPPSLIGEDGASRKRRCQLSARIVSSVLVTRSTDCAVLAPRWVLTRASALPAAKLASGRLVIRVGRQEFGVTHLVYHPRWSGTPDHDLALVKLAAPVPGVTLSAALRETLPENAVEPISPERSDRRWIAAIVLADDPLAPASARAPSLLARLRVAWQQQWGSSTPVPRGG